MNIDTQVEQSGPPGDSMQIKRDKTAENQKVAMHVSKVTIAGNVGLSALKFAAGVIGNSGALISDAVHSLSDVLSTFVVMAGVKMAGKEADKDHPYGHERMESVASIILAVFLFLTGIAIGYVGITKILAGNFDQLAIPSVFALVVAAVSIGVKEWMYWYTRAAAKEINSGALMADAWHHRSDALSSIGAFAGILAAEMGFPIFDPIASVVICVFIVKAAWDVFKDALDKMVDKACDPVTQANVTQVILDQDGVMGLDSLKTRLFGSRMYVDVEIEADGTKTLNETHAIAEAVHHAIENNFEDVKHCMVHVNPAPETRPPGQMQHMV